MNIAEGSLEECRYYLILTKDLGYAETAGLSLSREEVRLMLHAYAAAILAPGS
jgi:four helix bundle protein